MTLLFSEYYTIKMLIAFRHAWLIRHACTMGGFIGFFFKYENSFYIKS